MKFYIKYFFLFWFCFLMKETFSQNNVGIGTTTPASDAVLELKSSNQGVLVPRLSTVQRLAISNPSNGLLVYDTNYNCFYYYNAPATTWNSMCTGPTAPTQKANVQIFTSQGVCTYINSATPTLVNGLSITVILTDTATVILSSSGNIEDTKNTGKGMETLVQLYQNGLPIAGTAQTNGWDYGGGLSTSPPPVTNLSWSVSTIFASLVPGTYLFELEATHLNYDDFYAACNTSGKNQGIITAEVIY